MKFKLIRGIHADSFRVPGKVCPKCNGEKVIKSPGSGVSFPCTACRGTGELHEKRVFVARDPKNNIVTSEIDLEAKFGSDKFQNIDKLNLGHDAALRRQLELQQAEINALRAQLEGKKATEEADNPNDGADPSLQEMSVKELRAFAAENDIDLGTATLKTEIVNTIQSALDAQ